MATYEERLKLNKVHEMEMLTLLQALLADQQLPPMGTVQETRIDHIDKYKLDRLMVRFESFTVSLQITVDQIAPSEIRKTVITTAIERGHNLTDWTYTVDDNMRYVASCLDCRMMMIMGEHDAYPIGQLVTEPCSKAYKRLEGTDGDGNTQYERQ